MEFFWTMENICYCDITRHIIISRDWHALKLHYLQSYISIEMEILEYIWKKPIKNLFIKWSISATLFGTSQAPKSK